MKNEECWTIYGRWIGSFFIGCLKDHIVGETSTVSFDWKRCYKRKDLIGWYHTHLADKHLDPSLKDHRAMRSWVRGLGRPFLCGIKSGNQMALYLYSKCYYHSPQICYRKVLSFKIGPILFGKSVENQSRIAS